MTISKKSSSPNVFVGDPIKWILAFARMTLILTLGISNGLAIDIDQTWLNQNGPAPYVLNQANATYSLQTDVQVQGAAFHIDADNIVFDLNGRTIEYGANNQADQLGIELVSGTQPNIKNGTIQHMGTGAESHAIYSQGGKNSIIENVRIEVNGTDTSTIQFKYGVTTVRDCVLISNAQATFNRHQGPANVKVNQITAHNNVVIGGNSAFNVQDNSRLYDNLISNAAFDTNGFGVFTYQSDNIEISDNIIMPSNGRGILLAHGNGAKVYDNVIFSHELPNGEFGNGGGAAGRAIAFKWSVKTAHVKGNTLLGMGGTTGVSGLKYAVWNPGQNVVENNVITAVRLNSGAYAQALAVESSGKNNPTDGVIKNNIFRSNHLMVRTEGDTGQARITLPLTGNEFSWIDGTQATSEFLQAVNNKLISIGLDSNSDAQARIQHVSNFISSNLNGVPLQPNRRFFHNKAWAPALTSESFVTLLDSVLGSGVDPRTYTGSNNQRGRSVINVGNSHPVTIKNNLCVDQPNMPITLTTSHGTVYNLLTDSQGQVSLPIIQFSIFKDFSSHSPAQVIDHVESSIQIVGQNHISAVQHHALPTQVCVGGSGFPPPAGPFSLTVTTGTHQIGPTPYSVGSLINIMGDPPPINKEFDQWVGYGASHVANVNGANTTITMPPFNATLTAVYKIITNSNGPPQANPGTHATGANQPVLLSLSASDPDSDPLTYSIVSGPQNGSLNTSNLPSVTYTPNLDYIGSDSFTFKVNDGQVDSNIATVDLQISGGTPPPTPTNAQLPNPPQAYLDTTFNLPTCGNTINVNSGDDLQAAIDNANPCDVLVLEAGATFTGNFVLPNKPNPQNEWIYIISSALDQMPEGVRVVPGDAIHMSTLEPPPYGNQNTYDQPALNAEFGAHHYYVAGIQIKTDRKNIALVAMGYDGRDTTVSAQTLNQLPSYITFDRMYVHSTSDVWAARTGFNINGSFMAVINSRVENFKDTGGSDANAIFVWNGPGPYKIVNNFLEASHENIIFGGTDPGVSGTVPADIEIQQNHVMKRLSWKGTQWNFKNLLELKNAERVLIQGNIFENSWHGSGGQNGGGIVLTPRNQNGGAPHSVVRDITYTYNIMRHVGEGFNISGEDNLHPSQQTKRILIAHNIIEDITTNNGSGRAMKITSGGPRPVQDLIITNNLHMHSGTGASAVWFETDQGNPLVIENNILTHGQYGIVPQSVSNVIDINAPNTSVRKNVLVFNLNDAQAAFKWNSFDSNFPENFKESSMDAIGFIDLINKDYHIQPGTPYSGAGTDGKDLGPDIPTLLAYTAGVVSGNPSIGSPPPPPPPPPPAPTDAQLPNPLQKFVDSTFNLPTCGSTINVNAGDDLQAAIDNANPCDVLVLEAGATFSGVDIHPKPNSQNEWIYMISSRLGELPEGKRVNPADKNKMAKILVTTDDGVIDMKSGASYWHFAGIEMAFERPDAGDFASGSYMRGNNDHVIFDRCYIHGHPEYFIRAGINIVSSNYFGLIHSYLDELHKINDGSYGIQLQNGSPVLIHNNHIEASTINLFFGDNGFQDPGPEDVMITNNYLHKPDHWKHPISAGPYQGQCWTFKNLLEFKAGRRVLIEGNIFDNQWFGGEACPGSQGSAVFISGRGDGQVIEDILFQKNIVRNVNQFTSMGSSDAGSSLKRIMVVNNLFTNNKERFFSFGNNGTFEDLIFRHNTAVNADPTGTTQTIYFNHPQSAIQRVYMSDNILQQGPGKWFYTNPGSADYADSIATALSGEKLENELIVGPLTFPNWYGDPPFQNFSFETQISDVGFSDLALSSPEHFKLSNASPYKNSATDGMDMGVDIDALIAATQCVEGGTCHSIPIEPDPEDPDAPGSSPDPEEPTNQEPKKFKNIISTEHGNEIEIDCDHQIDIYNRRGNLVKSLMCVGGTVSWNGDNVPSGIYFVRENEKDTRKVVVIK